MARHRYVRNLDLEGEDPPPFSFEFLPASSSCSLLLNGLFLFLLVAENADYDGFVGSYEETLSVSPGAGMNPPSFFFDETLFRGVDSDLLM